MSLSEQNADPYRGGGRVFATTHWSIVVAAGRAGSSNMHQALETLCRAYWYPLYAYVLRRGYSPAEAQDLTQEFFSRLLSSDALGGVERSKGKFRSFLLASMNHLLANEWHRNQAQKRGGGAVIFSIDAGEEAVDLPENLTPEKLYERRWAEAVLDRVVERLKAEWDARSRAARFDELKTFLLDHKANASFAEAAGRLGLTVPAIKSAVQRLRQRYRDIFREEIAQTVSGPGEVEEEIRHLFAALSS